ncbi:MAG TPA: methyltransferase domain-containing protein [Xanthobacteraceae bacterium]
MTNPRRVIAMALGSSVDFTHRGNEPEWLDGTDIDPAELDRALRDLARFNRTFLGHYLVLRWLRRAIGLAPKGTPLTVVDVGCGYGDLLRAIRHWSRRQALELKLVGVDLNPETIRIARTVTNPADRIEFRVANIFELGRTMPVDFMISSLVAHHLSDTEICEFLGVMEAVVRRGWLIYDLERHRFLYHFIGLTARLARLHPMVVQDGQISVRRSLTRTEWEERIAAAGISPADVTIRWFLFRFLIGRLR